MSAASDGGAGVSIDRDDPFGETLHTHTWEIYTGLRKELDVPPHRIFAKEFHSLRSGERFSSRTSLGIEETLWSSYSDSLVDDSPCSTICSVVTLICRGEFSVPDLGIKLLTIITCMLVRPVGDSRFERPNLNPTLVLLLDGSVPPVSGSPSFDGEMTSGPVVGTVSCWSEDRDVTQYTTSAFTMT